ncbi:hypothetical protein FSW04_02785 [Baekduia soli]|uniref:Uncharacterized protein n=1 Tax=Baekduia soli TaxID=496014 RepID=A0A5B8U0Z5_9ACTN|nr:hypothetical protein [Baekduia soli]QEC46610.1 hypothetical protein FSW04_02785 [Baekduia soli]
MPRRIDLGRAVLVAGAALLFISLFLRWYDTGPTGWQVFETLDLVLAGLAAAGVAVALRPDAAPRWAAWGVPGAAIVIVLVQLVDAPPAAGDGDPATGAWLALGAGLVMACGAVLSLATISITVQVRPEDPRRRVPAVDRRDAGGPDPGAGPDVAVDPADALVPDVPRRGRFLPRGAAAPEPAPAPEPAAEDPQRTQPLAALEDPAPDAERP